MKNKNIIIIVIIVAVLCVLGFAANLMAQNNEKPEETPTPMSSSDPSSSETTEGEPTPLPESANVDWETKIADNGMATYEIPTDWERNELNSTVGFDLYVPSSLDATNRTSNVIVQMSETGTLAPEYEVSKEAFYSTIDEQLKTSIPDVEITNKRDYQASYGYVFEVTMNYEIEGTNVNQTESYYVVDNYLCTITASDFKHDISPTVFEVSQHIIDTIVFDEYGEGVELTIDPKTGEITENEISEDSSEELDPNTMTEEEIIAELTEDKGTWEGKTYTNKNIDFSITIPETWEYLSWEEIYGGLGDWALDAYEVFAFSPNGFEMMQIYLEKHVGDTTLSEYMTIAEEQMLSSASKTYTIEEKYSKKIAGNDYEVIEATSVAADGTTLKEYNLVTKIDDNFMCITVTCLPENAENAMKLLEENIK